MAQNDARDSIMEATARVLARSGVAGATLEAVAAEAGISKGGMLHYFRNKRDLLAATLNRFSLELVERRDAICRTLPEAPDRLARATVAAIAAAREEPVRIGIAMRTGLPEPKMRGVATRQCETLVRSDNEADWAPAAPCARETCSDRLETSGDAGHYRVDVLEDLGYRRQIGEMRMRLLDDMFRGSPSPEKILVAVYMLDGLHMARRFDPPPIPPEVDARAREWLEGFIEGYLAEFGRAPGREVKTSPGDAPLP